MKTLNKTNLFLILTLGISYLVAACFYFLGGDYDKTSGIMLATSYMFIPAIVTLIVERWIHKEEIKQNLQISFKINKWFVIGWLIMPVIGFVTFGISLLFPDVSYAPGMEGMFNRFEEMLTPEKLAEMRSSLDSMPLPPIVLAVLSGLMAGITINAIAGFGEELGWRGFLLRQFQGRSFMKAVLFIGFVWGIWHAPIILMGHNYPEHPVAGVFMMIAWCILLTPLFLYITIKAKSVIAAAVMHGTLNGSIGIAIMYVKGGNEMMIGYTGFSGFIALALVTLGFFIYDVFISKEGIMVGKIDLE